MSEENSLLEWDRIIRTSREQVTGTGEADVVVYLVEGRELTSWGRGTLAEAEAHCRRPKWPATLSDHFVAIDNWGYNDGTIVAASPSLSNWIGHKAGQFRREVH